MIEKNQWSDPFNFCSGIYSYLKDTFQQVGFQFGGTYRHFFSGTNWPRAKHSNIWSRPLRGLDHMFECLARGQFVPEKSASRDPQIEILPAEKYLLNTSICQSKS